MHMKHLRSKNYKKWMRIFNKLHTILFAAKYDRENYFQALESEKNSMIRNCSQYGMLLSSECREKRNMDGSTHLFSRTSLYGQVEKSKLSVNEQYIVYLEKYSTIVFPPDLLQIFLIC